MASALYKVEPIPGKAQGVIATSSIARGTLILLEPPLFKVPQSALHPSLVRDLVAGKLKALDKDQQRIFFSLLNNFKNLSPFEAIVKTNTIPLGADADEGGIFPICSRFNHSCVGNAAYSWCGRLGVERVYTNSDIKEGEEITVEYLSDEAWAKPRADRQRHLLREFGFECCCTVCGAAASDVAASDRRRLQIAQYNSVIGDGILIMTNPNRALRHCRDTMRLFSDEGEADIKVYVTYYDAFQICTAHGDFARASTFAALAAKIACQGSDADGIKESQSNIESPQRHRLAGTTKRWRSKVEHARSEDSEGFEEWLWVRAG